MPEKKTDRRIGRTRRELHKALIALILEKGYEAVTVQDILDRADVGRSTFYAHYRDKEDLLLSGFDEVFQSFQAHLKPPADGAIQENSGKQISLMVFQHAAGHREVFKAMFGGEGIEVVFRYARKSIAQIFRSHLHDLLKDRPARLPEEVLIHFAVNSFLSLLTWWLDEGFSIPPKEMNQIFWDLTAPGIMKALAASSEIR